MFLIDLAVLFLSSVQISVFGVNAQNFYFDDFVFPLEKSDNLSSCTFDNGTLGQCVKVSECPHANDEYKSGINPTLCHFERDEPVVCCILKMIERPLFDQFIKLTTDGTTTDGPGNKNTSGQLFGKRKSAASCDDVYSLAVPFQNIPGQFHITIVGGQVTSEREFPHMAALGWTDNDKNISWRCGGALISHDFVLTAAHCVIGRIPPDIIRVGEKDLINTDLLVLPQDFGVELIIGHPEYQPNQFYNDIALIKLNKSATITTKVRPACLWQGNSINFTEVIATGYGHTSFGGRSSNELLKVDLKIFNNDECTAGYQNDRSLDKGIVESQLCAGDSTGEKDTCQGDSGGPIAVSTMNEMQIVYHVVGVTSFGKACASTLPGVYTRVSHYLDWIENIVWR